MGNQVSNPNNNDQFKNNLLGQEIKRIIMNKTVENTNNVKFFTDENKNKLIKINQLKACCVGAVGAPGSINSTLGIPLPAIDPAIKDINTDCKPGKPCLITRNVGFTIETQNRNEFCGDNMDAKSTEAKTCDALLTDSCTKQLYEQGCIKLSGKKNSMGKSLAAWNSANPMCMDKRLGREVLYTGGPECTCVNSIFGPGLNKGPSYNLFVKKDIANPYGLVDKTLDLDDTNDDSVYSLNIFKQDDKAMHPGILDSRCVAKIKNRTDTAYNLSYDRNVPIGSICIQSINLSDSNVGKAVFEGNSFENNCGTVASGKNSKPAIRDDEDLRIEEEARQKELARKAAEQKKAEEERKAEEARKLKELEDLRIKQLKEKEENDLKEKARLEKLAQEQQRKYAEEIKKQEEEKKKKEEEEKRVREEIELKAKIVQEEKLAKEKIIQEEKLAREKRIQEEIQAKERLAREEQIAADIKRKYLQEQEIIKAKQNEENKIKENQAAELKAKLAQAEKTAADIRKAQQEAVIESSQKSTSMYIGGGIGLILIIIIIFLLLRSRKSNESDD